MFYKKSALACKVIFLRCILWFHFWKFHQFYDFSSILSGASNVTAFDKFTNLPTCRDFGRHPVFSFFRITDYCFFNFCHTVISIRLSRFFSSFFADFFLLFWFLFTFQVSMIGSAWGLGSAAAFNQKQKESKRISVSTPRPLSQSGLAPIDISTPHYWAVSLVIRYACSSDLRPQ